MAYCRHCNSKIRWLDEIKTSDGVAICSSCANLLSLYKNRTKSYNQLVALEEKKKVSNQFAVKTDNEWYFDKRLFVNNSEKVFGICGKGGTTCGSLEKFKQAEYHEEIEEVQIETQKASSGAGRAVAGAILFGPVGAVAGGLSGRKAAQYRMANRATFVGFVVRYSDDSIERFNLLHDCFSYSYADCAYEEYHQVKFLSESMVQKLNDKFVASAVTHNHSENASKIEMLERLAKLKEAGILSEEEFLAQKSEILR